MSHNPADPHTWPQDLIGHRAETDELVFRCSCGCGGHVLISRRHAVGLDVARAGARERAAADGEAPCFGRGYFIEGHEPMGLAASKLRTGKRTQLRATT